MRRTTAWILSVMVAATACSGTAADTIAPSTATTSTAAAPIAAAGLATTTTSAPPPSTTTSTTHTPTTTVTTTTISPFARHEWLGTRLLPLRDDGFGEILPTPAELIDRAFATPDHLPPPATNEYVWTMDEIPSAVVARSTWRDECPVGLDDLRYLTFSHHGFDGDLHTGELIVHRTVAHDIVWVFGELFAAGFPIEEFQVTTMEQLDAPPTGDRNRSGAFGCRPVAGRDSGWSQHAYGLAIDINPFHNPYRKGDLVIPELASYYLDRSLDLSGMIGPDSMVVAAFAAIGWKWGGNWNSLDDWMHFSQNGH